VKQETLDAMRAWLDGETIQAKRIGVVGGFVDLPNPTFRDDLEYRIKPRTIRIGEYEVEENISLIMASQDLLDVCLMILEANASYDYEYKLKIPREMIDKIEKAVNKARGEV
jgi:hypothetical protein